MKKITFNLFSFLFLTLTTSVCFGQNIKEKKAQQFGRQIEVPSQERTPSGHIRCYTSENETFLKSTNPQRESILEFENWLSPLIDQIRADRAAGRNIQAVYNIPVVIHIIHNGDCLGTGENITDAQAISQINVLNQDFRRLAGTLGGANSTGLAVDAEINFILAKRDPNGNPTNGIDRVQTTTASYNRAAVETEKANTIWDPTKYLNMWTFRFSGDLDGVLGYAQFPTGSTLTGIPAGTTTANTDGVVASYDAFGTIAENDGSFILNSTYNLGRTMTHEVGHWLGLRHIWGDDSTCPLANTNTTKDYCADTPAASEPNYECIVVNTCTVTPGNDMIQNYMDYTNDACMDTFTAEQKLRMQTVMANSPRRSTLNASNGATAPSAGIYFNQGAGKCEVVETTSCSFTDVNYNLSIIKAPTSNAVVTFAVDGTSTATNNVDFQILTPTVTFNSGSTANQTLTIRYFNDGIVEPVETVKITMTVNANGGDGTIITSKSTLSVSIIDNDVASSSTTLVTLLSETFDPSPTLITGIKDLDGDTNNWGISLPSTNSTAIGFTTNLAFSRSWDGVDGLNPDNILYTPTAIALPTGTLNLSFAIGTTQGGSFYKEHYSVYLTTVNPSTFTTATLNAQTPVINDAELAGPTQRNIINVDISSYGGQTVYLVFRHHNTFDMNLIMLDDVLITKTTNTAVQTEVNAATKYQVFVPTAGTFYSKDTSTGNVMLDATPNAFNYGCTSVEVNRSQTSAGAAAVNYGSNTANNLKVMAKTFLVTPTTNSSSGNATLKFYFTEAEIAAWETATGNTRTALKVFKGGETATYATTLAAFGTNISLTATTNTGLAGTYYFGTDATLSTQSFDLLSGVSIYPNPTTNELNISLNGDFETATSYTIYNSLGQKISNKKVGSQADLKINTSSYSNGVYFITIERDGNSKTIKFIKN